MKDEDDPTSQAQSFEKHFTHNLQMPLSFYHDLLWREVIYISLSLCFDRWTLYTFHFMWTASSFDMKDWAGKRRHEVKSTRCEENTRTLIKYWGWRFWSNWNPNFVPKNLEQPHQIRSRIVPSHVIHLEAITDLQHESAAKKKTPYEWGEPPADSFCPHEKSIPVM